MLISHLIGFAVLAQSASASYPEVQNFKDVAEFTIGEIRKETSERDWLIALHHELTHNGSKILDRYRHRHPACARQLDQLRAELPRAHRRTYGEITERYHDGVGLPAAPAHCIYGRVYLVHPVINLLRLQKGVTAADRALLVADLTELLQYLPKLQKNLEPEAPKEN